MSSTDENLARSLAAALFDTVVSPLAQARQAAGKQTYFPLAAEPGAESYYEEPVLCVMQPSDFEFPGSGTVERLVDALAASWITEGETDLAAMAPALKQIAEALADEALEGNGSVSILCYTMF